MQTLSKRVKARPGRPRDERGASAVEFAIVSCFLLFPLLFGIIQFGAIFLVQNQLTEAASDAARVAVPYTTVGSAVTNSDYTSECPTGTDTATCAAEADLYNIVNNDQNGIFNADCNDAKIICEVTPTDSGSDCATPPSGYECLTVTVEYVNYAGLVGVYTPNVSGTSTVLVGGATS